MQARMDANRRANLFPKEKQMFRNVNLIAVLATVLLASNLTLATTTLKLNTGYNHSGFSAYPAVTGTPDNYWINIASYPTTSPPVGPSFVLNILGTPWLPPFSTTNWIGPRPTAASAPGTSPDNPAYTIFRKCFCLLPGYKEAKLTISRVRADDTIQVWLNSQVNQVIGPSWGNWSWGTPLSGSTKQGFRVGKNCLYVLVEDFRGHMGFDLLGDVTADGLLPMPAAGTSQSFEPCACRQGPAGLADRRSVMDVDDDDQSVSREIVKIAEARRMAKQRMYQGRPPRL